MMMNGRHPEDPLPPVLVRTYLENHRQRLHHKDTADDDQEDLLLGDYRQGAEASAKGERANITHEDFGGVGVVPEKADAGTDQGAADHRQFPGAGHVRNLQVRGEFDVTGNVGEQQICGRVDGDRPDGEAVEAVGQVDGIARPDDDQHYKGDEKDPEVWMEVFEKRKVELGGEARTGEENDAKNRTQQHLPEHLLPWGEPLGVFFHHLLVVINETDDPVTDDNKEGQPDIGIGEVGPEQRRNNDTGQDHHPSHSGGPLFLQVRFRAVGTDDLACLK